jgi:cytochrome oxidase Cu insertion factor (SCO1/SenC/PrrC family)
MTSESSSLEASPSQGRSRKVLVLLAIIFLLPFSVAALLHLLEIKPSGKSYGDLIQPPRQLQIPLLHDAQGREFAAIKWQKKWNLVTVNRTSCDEACQAQTHMLRQVHVSLGKETNRVQRIVLTPVEINAEATAGLQKEYPDLILLTGTDVATTQFVREFESASQAGSVYLVDPLGNLMMHYPKNFEPKGLRADLIRLLKNSWAG